MSYTTYITEAIVCGGEDTNTADRSFLLFTREAGMLYASAKSVRREESKHRYALQEFSYARVTLVRGKGGWRVTGAEPIANFYALAETRAARSFLRNIVLLLRRVLRGEVPHPEIFDDVTEAVKTSGDHEPHVLESVLTLRTLHTLGYVSPDKRYEHLIGGLFPHRAVAELDREAEEACRRANQRALTESHL